MSRRRGIIAQQAALCLSALDQLDHGALDLATADRMIENVIGTYALPLGVALNFRINGRDVLLPMAIEEPSVVAAASNAARIVRESGGFDASCDPPIMTAQVQLTDVPDPDEAVSRIAAATADIMAAARQAIPRLCLRGGGPRGLGARVLSRPGDPDGGMVVVHLEIDCRDAMGANVVNSVAEALADELAALAHGRVGLRILTNLAEKRLVRARCLVTEAALSCEARNGAAVLSSIVAACRFAELDPYRAATHNKGIMNGIDAVLVATGNDWRGVEAGAHAWAARSGRYRPLALWRAEGGHLVGELELPLAVGIVGGALRAHPGAKLALEILGAQSSSELAGAVAAAGLATNLAALRALATEGIQRGHMALHARLAASGSGRGSPEP